IDEKHREILFLKETNEHIAVWEGPKLTKQQAFETSGVRTVYWLKDSDKIIAELVNQCDTIYYNHNEHYRAKVETETREERFNKWLKKTYPHKKVERSNPILQRLRSIKDPAEIDLIQKACDITNKGFRRILNFVKPGVWEYEIEAEFIHEFLNNRSKRFAYTPIIASGKNANILHYNENNKKCKGGDLILLDVGAEYANYSSDMTRTIPVSGRFTKRQKDIYNAVLKVKNEATKMLVPGADWKQYHVEVGNLMTTELLSLGLLDKSDIKNETEESPAYKKYFMHGTSHHMGLDTHDYGLLDEPMQANMVFTVEPGIYLPDEGFGIRLEDDVVIQTAGDPINLMKDIPIEIEEIEELMNN
ncbi:MAG: aminopeptidase P family protein, partial [Flavobacteriaceae bacterium]|nr:aminopeptidase P family protein [Flavobacteriaceae bacterium]